MCFALFMAAGSFFLGQARLFPASVRRSGLLVVPVLLVLGAMLYWMARLVLIPRLRRLTAAGAVVSIPGRAGSCALFRVQSDE
jgi:hypothetical protein